MAVAKGAGKSWLWSSLAELKPCKEMLSHEYSLPLSNNAGSWRLEMTLLWNTWRRSWTPRVFCTWTFLFYQGFVGAPSVCSLCILAHGILPRLSVTLVRWVSTVALGCSTWKALRYLESVSGGRAWASVLSKILQAILTCSQLGRAAPVKQQGCLHACLPSAQSRGASHSGACSAFAVLEFLIFEQGVLHLHFASSPANYAASPVRKENMPKKGACVHHWYRRGLNFWKQDSWLGLASQGPGWEEEAPWTMKFKHFPAGFHSNLTMNDICICRYKRKLIFRKVNLLRAANTGRSDPRVLDSRACVLFAAWLSS